MRLFIGIKPDKKALLVIQGLIKKLQSQGITGNYTDVNNIHMTLVFIGEVTEEKMFKNIMDRINHPQFSFRISKLKCFKDMIILEIIKTKELEILQEKITIEMAKQGYNIEKRNFYPHITLVRKAKEKIEIDMEINSEVKSFELYLSQRIQGKINYSVIHKRMLGCETCE